MAGTVEVFREPASWHEFFRSDSFEKPVVLSAALVRATENLKFYAPNYAILGSGCVLLTTLSSPVVAVALLGSAGFAAAHAKDYRGMGRFSQRAVYSALGAIALCLVVFTNALVVMCLGLLLGAGACGAHAVMHDSPVVFDVINTGS